MTQQASGLPAWRRQEFSNRHNHGHTVYQTQSVLKYCTTQTTCDGMYTAIVVASVCPFGCLIGTIRGAVAVQRDRVDMYMAILSVINRF